MIILFSLGGLLDLLVEKIDLFGAGSVRTHVAI